MPIRSPCLRHGTCCSWRYWRCTSWMFHLVHGFCKWVTHYKSYVESKLHHTHAYTAYSHPAQIILCTHLRMVWHLVEASFSTPPCISHTFLSNTIVQKSLGRWKASEHHDKCWAFINLALSDMDGAWASSPHTTGNTYITHSTTPWHPDNCCINRYILQKE